MTEFIAKRNKLMFCSVRQVKIKSKKEHCVSRDIKTSEYKNIARKLNHVHHVVSIFFTCLH